MADGPPPTVPRLWSAVSSLDVLAAARTCAAEPGCTEFEPPPGLVLDEASSQPLLSVHSKGAMDVGPLHDWAAGHPGVELDEKLVHVDGKTGFEIDLRMDLLDTATWEGLRAALELISAGAFASVHGIHVQEEGVHADLAAAQAAITACAGDSPCLQALHSTWPWLDPWAGVGAFQVEVPHGGQPGEHDAIAGALLSLSWWEPPMVFAVEPTAGGEHLVRVVGRMSAAGMEGLPSWLAGQPWTARSRPLTCDEMSTVRLQLPVAEAAADLVACAGDAPCHWGVGQSWQALVSPAGRLGVVMHGEDPDIEGLNGLEYPGWSMAPFGWAWDGAAGLLAHEALRDLALGRWGIDEALSVGLDGSPEMVALGIEGWLDAFGEDDVPLLWTGDDDDSALPGDDDSAAGDDDTQPLPDPPCIAIHHTDGNTAFPGSLVLAAAELRDGDEMVIDCDLPTEDLLLVGLSGVAIRSSTISRIGAVGIQASTGIHLAFLGLDGTTSGGPALLVDPAGQGATLEAEHLAIRSGTPGVAAVLIKPGAAVEGRSLQVVGSAGVGILVKGPGSTVDLRDALVAGSHGSGIRVEEGAQLALTESQVVSNGAAGGGYGLQADPGCDPGDIRLDDVALVANEGETVEGSSTRDIGGWPAILDETDQRVGLLDPTALGGAPPGVLYSVLAIDGAFASWDETALGFDVEGLSEAARLELEAERLRQREFRSQAFATYGGGHPSLLDVTIGPAGPDLAWWFSCYSDTYDLGLGLPVDYIVDGPRVWAGLVSPPAAWPDISDALDEAAASGDPNGDGTIRICVEPGRYGPGIEIDYARFLTGGIPPLPEFDIFAAYGPDVTVIGAGPFGFGPEGWAHLILADNAVVIQGPPDPPPPFLFLPANVDVRLAGFSIPGQRMLQDQRDPEDDFYPGFPGVPGSAIRAENANLQLWRIAVEGNEAHEPGGALAMTGGSLEVDASAFVENIGYGGGGAFSLVALYGPAQVRTTIFEHNATYQWFFSGPDDGGAIHSVDTDLSISQSTFACNGNYRYLPESGRILCEILDEDGGDPWLAGSQPMAERGGAIFSVSGSLSVVESALTRNAADAEGGAVYAEAPSAFAADSSAFAFNTATADGGGLLLAGSNAPANSAGGSLFVSNSSADGGGGGLLLVDSILSMDAPAGRPVRFFDNSAGLGGGGAISVVDADLWSSSIVVGQNRAPVGHGGGVRVRRTTLAESATWIDEGSDIVGNTSGGDGAGVSAVGATLDFAGTRIRESVSGPGGSRGLGAGVYVAPFRSATEGTDQYAWFRCVDCQIDANDFVDRPGNGAGVYCSASVAPGGDQWDPSDPFRPTVLLETTTPGATSVSRNQAGTPPSLVGSGVVGGGLHIGQGCEVVANGVTINGNVAHQGGGIFVGSEVDRSSYTVLLPNADSVLRLTGATITSNHVAGFPTSTSPHGGGLRVGPAGEAILEDVEISSNTAAQDGGGVSCWGSPATVATLAMQEVEFRGNTATGSGGGVGARYCDLSHAGGLYESNWAGGDGGGLYAMPIEGPSSTLDLMQIEFFSNTAGDEGGAVRVQPQGTWWSGSIQNVVVADNTSAEAAVYLEQWCDPFAPAEPTVLLSHLTLAGNATTTSETAGLRLKGDRKPWLVENSLLVFDQGSWQYVAGDSTVDPCSASGTLDHAGLWNDPPDPAHIGDFDAGVWLEMDVGVYDPGFVGDPAGVTNPLAVSTDIDDFNFHLGPGSPASTAGIGGVELGAFGGALGIWSCSAGCP